MIRLSADGDGPARLPPPNPDLHARCSLLQRKLDAIRDYVELCAADELEPTAILDILDNPLA